MIKQEVAKLRNKGKKYDKNCLEILSNYQQGKDLALSIHDSFMSVDWSY